MRAAMLEAVMSSHRPAVSWQVTWGAAGAVGAAQGPAQGPQGAGMRQACMADG